ncbi:MAG: DUF3179 domain-containing protein [Chloroflexi bacterium]|nr:DUF3179 domain-containing protein [Chloroflexota bacterium]
MRSPIPWIALALAVGVMLFILFSPTKTDTVSLVSADGGDPSIGEKERTLEIVTLLPRDAIPAVYNPQFNAVETANREYGDTDLVIGVEIGGEARAYSIPFLSGHEIVNDTVGGQAIAVTW